MTGRSRSGLLQTLIAAWLIVISSGSVHAAGFDDVLGLWQGVQQCDEGELHTRLTIAVQGSEPQLEARMDLFASSPGGEPNASFEMQGYFMDYDGSVVLQPLRWLREAPGVAMFGFSGTLQDAGRIVGHADDGACAELAFARAGEEDTVQSVASNPEAMLVDRLSRAFAGAAETADGVETLLLRVTRYDRGTLQLEAEIVYPSLDATTIATGNARLNTSGTMPLDGVKLTQVGGSAAFDGCLNVRYDLIAAGSDRGQWHGTWRCLERGDGGSVLLEAALDEQAEAIRQAAHDWRAHLLAEEARAASQAAADSDRAEQSLAERIAAFEAEYQGLLEREWLRREEVERRRQDDQERLAAEAERLARVEWLVDRNTNTNAQLASLSLSVADFDFVSRCNGMRSVVRYDPDDCLNEIFGTGIAAVVHVGGELEQIVEAALCDSCRLRLKIDCGRRFAGPDDISRHDTMGYEPGVGWQWARDLAFGGSGPYCEARVRVPDFDIPAPYVLADGGVSLATSEGRAVGFKRPNDILVFGVSPTTLAAEAFDAFVAQGLPRVSWHQYGVVRREAGSCLRTTRIERDTTGRLQQVPLEMLALERQTVRADFAPGAAAPPDAPLYALAEECAAEFTGGALSSLRCTVRDEDAAAFDIVRHFTDALGPPATVVDVSGRSGGIWYCADYPDHERCIFEAATGPGGTYARITVDTRPEEEQLRRTSDTVAASDVCRR